MKTLNTLKRTVKPLIIAFMLSCGDDESPPTTNSQPGTDDTTTVVTEPPLTDTLVLEPGYVLLEGAVSLGSTTEQEGLRVIIGDQEVEISKEGEFRIPVRSETFGLVSVVNNMDALVGLDMYVSIEDSLKNKIIDAKSVAETLLYLNPLILSSYYDEFVSYQEFYKNLKTRERLEEFLMSSYNEDNFTLSFQNAELVRSIRSTYQELLETVSDNIDIPENTNNGRALASIGQIKIVNDLDGIDIIEQNIVNDSLSFIVKNSIKRHVDIYIGTEKLDGTIEPPKLIDNIQSRENTYDGLFVFNNDYIPGIWPAADNPYKISTECVDKINIEFWGLAWDVDAYQGFTEEEKIKFLKSLPETILNDYFEPFLELLSGVKNYKSKPELRGRPAKSPISLIFKDCSNDIINNAGDYLDDDVSGVIGKVVSKYIDCIKKNPKRVADFIANQFGVERKGLATKVAQRFNGFAVRDLLNSSFEVITSGFTTLFAPINSSYSIQIDHTVLEISDCLPPKDAIIYTEQCDIEDDAFDDGDNYKIIVEVGKENPTSEKYEIETSQGYLTTGNRSNLTIPAAYTQLNLNGQLYPLCLDGTNEQGFYRRFDQVLMSVTLNSLEVVEAGKNYQIKPDLWSAGQDVPFEEYYTQNFYLSSLDILLSRIVHTMNFNGAGTLIEHDKDTVFLYPDFEPDNLEGSLSFDEYDPVEEVWHGKLLLRGTLVDRQYIHTPEKETAFKIESDFIVPNNP
ncbi:MAG: hypothetical protein RIG62_03520 [Cyclobacteriaceae bacterium]